MKTCHFHFKACTLLATLATMTLAGSAHAEDEGVVRLGGSPTAATASTSDEGVVVVRGQSDYRRRNARTSKALLRLISGSPTASQPVACDAYPCDADACDATPCVTDACDGCSSCDAYPVTPISPYPTEVYSGTECAPVCDNCDAYAPINDSCDGCAPSVGSCDGADACSRCNGNGCRQCGFSGYRSAHADGGLLNRMTDSPYGYSGTECSVCDTRACINRNCVASFLGEQAAMHRARKRHANMGLNAYLRCKLGYFIPTGSGGAGSKLFGHYTRVYADNPAHFDGRDGQVYAAPGVGGPVSIPLAPNVRHAYNYGWGIPSSRLTPISNAAY